jgi:hypothetical protein
MFPFVDVTLDSILNISLIYLLVLIYTFDKTNYHNRCLHYLKDPSCIRALCEKYTNHDNKKIAYIAKFICKYLPSDVSLLKAHLYNTNIYEYWFDVRMNGSKDLITTTIHSIQQFYIKELKDQTSILNRLRNFLSQNQNFRDLYYQKLYENNDFILFKDKTLAVQPDLILLVSLTIKAIFASMDEKFYLLYTQSYKNNKLAIVFKDFTGRKDAGYYTLFVHEITMSCKLSHDKLVEILIHEFAHSINDNQFIMMSKQYSPTLCESVCEDYKTITLKYAGTPKCEYYIFTNPLEFHSELILFWLYDLTKFNQIKPSYTDSILWGFKKNGVNDYFDKIFIKCMGPYLDKNTRKKKNFVKRFLQIPSQDLIKLMYDTKGTKK